MKKRLLAAGIAAAVMGVAAAPQAEVSAAERGGGGLPGWRACLRFRDPARG